MNASKCMTFLESVKRKTCPLKCVAKGRTHSFIRDILCDHVLSFLIFISSSHRKDYQNITFGIRAYLSGPFLTRGLSVCSQSVSHSLTHSLAPQVHALVHEMDVILYIMDYQTVTNRSKDEQKMLDG